MGDEMEIGNETVQSAIRGDSEAFERLILAHEKLIFNIAYQMLGNVEDARDASQDIVLKIYRNLKKCSSLKHFKNWVCVITNNTCIDELRRRKGAALQSLDDMIESEGGDMPIQIASGDPTPLDEVVRRESAGALTDAINRLPPNQKSLIVLRDIQGLSYAELAAVTSLPDGTIKSRLSRARANLKKILSYFGEQIIT
jgi:RNA polymerase sigma-70 factor (ECF subfamily)